MEYLKLMNTNIAITAEDREHIQRSTRALVALTQPKPYPQARRHRFNVADHLLAWRIAQIAGGATLRFDGITAAAQVNPKDTKVQLRQRADAQRVDALEDVRRLRTRGVVARQVRSSHRELLAAAVLAGTEQ